MFLLRVLLFAFASFASSLLIDGDAVFVVSPQEAGPVSLAVRDVLRDAYLVLGRRPLILGAPPAVGALPPNTTLILLGTPAAAPWLTSAFPSVPSRCLVGWESHCVLVGGGTIPGYARTVVATGEGVRGAIFGAYTFSEEILGVNPWGHFTDDTPSFVGALEIADDFAAVFAPPRFKYRGFFINDEDLSSNLWRDPLGLANIDLRAYDRFLETLLRLKTNLLVPATNPFPDQQVYALIVKRGAVVSFHHYDLVGGNVFAWPLPHSDWTWRYDPGTMASLYRASIDAIVESVGATGEVLWSVGLRGLNDISYQCSTTAECGREISEAMGNQSAWIRAKQPNATLIYYLWQEDLDYLTEGVLTLPPGVDLVFTDAGSGFIRVNSNWTKYCSGVYYHTAMLDGQANQLSEMVPADRIFAQFKPVVNQSRATSVMIDNISDLRPVPLTTDALMKYAWDPSPYDAATSPAAAALAHYAAFGARQLHLPGGPTDASALAYAQLWADFFLIPYIQGGSSDNFLSGAISRFARAAALSISHNATVSPSDIAGAATAVLRLSNGTDASGSSITSALAALVSRATALTPMLPPARQGWYVSHTVTQISLHTSLTLALTESLDAMRLAASSNWTGAQAAAAVASASAEGALAALRDGEAASAPETWRGLYEGDYLTNVQGAADAVRALVAALSAPGSRAPLPPSSTTAQWYAWDFGWEVNAEDVAARYPLSQRFDPTVAFSVMPRVNCVFADVDAGACTPNPTGGIWVRGKRGAVTLQVMTSNTAAHGAAALLIRYTVDGSTPTAASPAYEAGHPLVLDDIGAGSASVVLTASVFDATGALVGGTRVTTWAAV